MAFRFRGKQLGAGSGRTLLGSSTSQIRGYCQQASSTPVLPERGGDEDGGKKLFVIGSLSSIVLWHLVIGIGISRVKKEEIARRKAWEAQKKAHRQQVEIDKFSAILGDEINTDFFHQLAKRK